MLRMNRYVILAIGCVAAYMFAVVDGSSCRAQTSATAATINTTSAENPLAADFRRCDADANGWLSQNEYLLRDGRDERILRREFLVFDSDDDGRLVLEEFVTVPIGQPEDQRGTIADPVIEISLRHFAAIKAIWKHSDQNADDLLDLNEFSNVKMPSRVSGLESLKFADWDLNHDGQVSIEEVSRVLEIAFGIRTPDGGLLRSNTGRVVDWNLFRQLKADEKGMVGKEEYFRALGAIPNREEWLATTDKNGDGQFDFAEFAKSNHRTDPVGTFLMLDTDLNGKLSPAELETLPAGWQEMALEAFRGCDDNHDGMLSLREYQLLPHNSLLAPWQAAVDSNNDGMLSREEFRFGPGIALIGLCAEYFRRFDLDQNRFLTLEEFTFVTNHPSANEMEIHVQYADDSKTVITIPDYPLIFSPEISPDGKWVAVDGWKHGQNNVAAHVLIASTETDEVRDLGTGCIPHWSADGKRIAYSKYGQGVFIRDFDGNRDDEESIDRQGWAIHFSTDGNKVAYVKNGGNLVVHDLKSGTKKFIFPQGGQLPYNYIEHNFAWSNDSERICFKGHKPNGTVEVCIVLTTGDDPKLRVRCDGKDVQSDFSWLSDGKRIMFPRIQPGQKTQIYEIDPDSDTPAVRYLRQPKNRNNGNVCWSRDGKTFVYMSTR